MCISKPHVRMSWLSLYDGEFLKPDILYLQVSLAQFTGSLYILIHLEEFQLLLRYGYRDVLKWCPEIVS